MMFWLKLIEAIYATDLRFPTNWNRKQLVCPLPYLRKKRDGTWNDNHQFDGKQMVMLIKKMERYDKLCCWSSSSCRVHLSVLPPNLHCIFSWKQIVSLELFFYTNSASSTAIKSNEQFEFLTPRAAFLSGWVLRGQQMIKLTRARTQTASSFPHADTKISVTQPGNGVAERSICFFRWQFIHVYMSFSCIRINKANKKSKKITHIFLSYFFFV
jgi:hypothetical protein